MNTKTTDLQSPYRLWLICAVIIITHFGGSANAQSWSVPAKSGEMMFNATVYLESIHARPGSSIKDTLAGTGTLVTDKGRIYLVTAKHIIQRDMNVKALQLANDSIYINPSWRASVKGNQIVGLSDKAGINAAVIFSSDEDDIAIISFQRKQDKPILANLLKNEKKPIPLTFISQSNHLHPGDSFFHIRFFVMRNKNGKPERSQGLGPETIVSCDPKSPLFTLKNYYGRGTDGSPLFMNNKMIGMVTGAGEVKPSVGITPEEGHPKEIIVTAVKASYILPLLRKLQKIENTTGFN